MFCPSNYGSLNQIENELLALKEEKECCKDSNKVAELEVKEKKLNHERHQYLSLDYLWNYLTCITEHKALSINLIHSALFFW